MTDLTPIELAEIALDQIDPKSIPMERRAFADYVNTERLSRGLEATSDVMERIAHELIG